MLYIALAIMIAILLIFTLVWLRSPELRRVLEQPKYRLLGIEQDEMTKVARTDLSVSPLS
jgi:hypothetical protein